MKNTREEQLIIDKAVNERISYVNLILAKIIFVIGAVTCFVWILFQFGIIKSDSAFIRVIIMVLPVVFIAIGIIAHILDGRKKWIKYAISFCLIFTVFFVDIISGYNLKVLLLIPVLVSMAYYSKHVTRFTGIHSVIFIFLSNFINAYFYEKTGYIDFASVYLFKPELASLEGDIMRAVIATKPDPERLFVSGLLSTVLPNALFVIIATVIALLIIDKNQKVIVSVEKMSRERAEHDAEYSKMKNKLMLSQIQPHFLFNSLSSIAALCDIDPELAKETTQNFTKYLRGNLSGLSEKGIIPFTEELEHTKAYIEIEKVRYQDRLTISYDIKVTDFDIPSLTFQPIVENAIKHGIAKKAEGGICRIRTFETEECYVLEIIDNGVGFNPKEIETSGGKHIGIENVRERLQKEVGGKLVITSQIGKGTNVKILIPKKDEEEI